MKLIYMLLGCCFCYNSIGQITTFNKRVQLGCGNTVLTSLEVTDSCYYITGGVKDTASNCDFGTLFTKYDTMGNLLFYKVYANFESWAPSLRTDFDGNLIVSTYNIDTVFRGGLLKYDLNGDTLWSKTFYNSYLMGDFFRPDDAIVTQDSGYLIASTVREPAGSGEISIIKLNSNRVLEWKINRNDVITAERIPCLYRDGDGSVVIGYMQDDLVSGTQMNYSIKSKLEKIDSLGNSVWVYQSPNTQQIHGVNDLIKSKDGGWVIASAWGSERLGATGTWSTPIQEAYVYKLDSSRNFLWGTKFHSDALTTANFQKIVALEDSSLVAFGTVVRLYPQPNPIYNIIHGRIVKLSPNGDSIWSREYEYLNTANSEHTIYDAERTPDGGFLICGEANIIGTGVHQQGWLLKLDEEGCLVPGCHLVSGALPTQKPAALNLLLYPNPTTDYLNVHYYNPSPQEDLSFRVLDVQGRLLKEYKTYDQSDKTYILPVYDLEAGVYILELRQEGALIGSEEFLKG
ncbi:T9SS type A sorting domain-containing protein [Aureispira anguillae]|uniref:T9SS type A sorting domain-containing protein n=1 Tax=Aureispira anguillae TaxID=2864201 RepID=A0A915YJU1_9BACT|nr:T9SS type A sorting domain-containing protein [Aureispira anguillae]BDS14385.1 T9SS type A sorting domain-containing protein [Aureispira anguillae]